MAHWSHTLRLPIGADSTIRVGLTEIQCGLFGSLLNRHLTCGWLEEQKHGYAAHDAARRLWWKILLQQDIIGCSIIME